jgi:hypothetical protein
MRRHTMPLAAVAVLGALSALPAVLGSQPASAATGCHSVFHYAGHDGAKTYDVYKYECSGNQTYGYMTGTPGDACITISLGNVTDGPCYSIPVGYTPPRTSIATPVVNAGATMKITDICFLNSQHGVEWCHNDYG